MRKESVVKRDRDIRPPTNSGRNPSPFFAQVEQTAGGRREAASSRGLPDVADRAATEAVRRSLEEMETGRGRPVDEVIDAIRRDFALPPDA